MKKSKESTKIVQKCSFFQVTENNEITRFSNKIKKCSKCSFDSNCTNCTALLQKVQFGMKLHLLHFDIYLKNRVIDCNIMFYKKLHKLHSKGGI